MKNTLFAAFLLLAALGQAQTPAVFNVSVDKPGAEVQPTMWGIFFEDINLGADGGLYAELVKNRSFEFYTPLMGWKEEKSGDSAGSLIVQNRGGKNAANPRYLRATAKAGKYGFSNEGFRGMGIRAGETYDFSVWTRQAGEQPVRLNIELRTPAGEVIGTAALAPSGKDWKKEKVSFTATATEPKAKLYIWLDNPGAVDLDMISLFPRTTWKNRPGGMRADLVQLLADLKPGFFRFPGGCIVEGRELATRYQWKKTMGNVEDRELIVNRWNTEFAHRPTPDYFQSFGLGFYEYFQLAEDIGAEPLPILNCGMACQFNTSEVVPLDQLDPYIQDALDLIEFANGPVTTAWGKLRADLGHPAPFNLKLLGVGNEQWGEQYVERHKIFTKAIKDKYPDIRLISAVGPFPDGEQFDYLSKEMTALKAEIVDEHYYRNPEWFLQNAGRYDRYDRSGPRVFAGEYAAQSVAVVSPDNKNNWRCAIAEAAFMTGLERNADLIQMASYAPLFAHTEGWQWTPNLIWFDNLRAFGTPNYYVQKIFSTNRGDKVLPILYQNAAAAGQDGLYASATFDQATGEVIVKIVNTTAAAKNTEIRLDGWKKTSGSGKLSVLRSDSPEAVNSLDQPTRISPAEQAIEVKDKKVALVLAAGSVSVIRVKN
ncbi:MAG: carbohydrate binding domain-containing protein [Lewinellaceae bacterium]|nr:carbohydrate binding domain-containing protein [Lewinellaceae bacterium]